MKKKWDCSISSSTTPSSSHHMDYKKLEIKYYYIYLGSKVQ